MRALLHATVLLAALTQASACGETCQSTCRHFYAPAPEGCGAAPEARTPEEAIAGCINTCQDALQVTGEPVDPNDPRFNPNFISPYNKTATLSNEQEAAAWIDCVWSFEDDVCFEKLDAQYCAKIF